MKLIEFLKAGRDDEVVMINPAAIVHVEAVFEHANTPRERWSCCYIWCSHGRAVPVNHSLEQIEEKLHAFEP